MLKTKFGQTPQELAIEFMAALEALEPEIPVGDAIYKKALVAEKQPSPPLQISKSIREYGITKFDLRELNFLANTKCQFSPVLLHLLATMSGENFHCLQTMLCLIAVAFYKDNPAEAKITLEWLVHQIGMGKVVSFRMIWPWYTAMTMEGEKPLYDVITPEDIYTYQK